MSMRYQRRNKNCSKSMNSHEPRIMRQLPDHLRAEFPAQITHRGGLSKAVTNVMMLLVQNSVGPKRFARILGELHILRHDHLELQYLNAYIQHQPHPTMFNFGRGQTFIPFSKFRDPLRYAGFIPSAKYLRLSYNAVIDVLRPSIDKQMMLIDGKYLKGDHPFRVIEYIGRSNPHQFSPQYGHSAMNKKRYACNV